MMVRRVEMPMDAVAGRELPRHHGDAAGRTHGTVDREVLEIRSFFGHLVDARRLAKRTAMDAQITVPPIVSKDKNDIGFSELLV